VQKATSIDSFAHVLPAIDTVGAPKRGTRGRSDSEAIVQRLEKVTREGKEHQKESTRRELVGRGSLELEVAAAGAMVGWACFGWRVIDIHE